MTISWHAILVISTIMASCERGLESTQNHIKSTLWCSLVLETLEAQMRIAMAKICIKAIEFEQVWIKKCVIKRSPLVDLIYIACYDM